jgi:alpha-glucosidase
MAHNPWWQNTTIYQIYPRSFMDSNNDGIGDLQGIISKLDYIQDLGFETIWISPFFASPQQDWGYDISDYLSIAPEYGYMAEVEKLVEQVHARDMRLLFDLVMNHTSIEHPWFQESRGSRDNPKRDWYIWRSGLGKRPPNNWTAIPGGSGWHFDEGSEQYYFASFLPFQPDLNYHHPQVREAMLNTARFWLEKGIDGYRLDIFHSVYKDAQLRDNPFSIHFVPHKDEAGFFQKWDHTLHQPETFQLARDLRAMAKSYSPEKMLIGEVFGNHETIKKYLGGHQDSLNLVFLWDLLQVKPKAGFFREIIQRYEEEFPPPYSPVYVFGNHDQKRLISKLGGEPRMAKLLALLQFTLRGVSVSYYGEEIGMSEGKTSIRQVKDPLGQRYQWVPPFLVEALNLYLNRDGCRTPMQWDDSPQAGFCSAETDPWMPVNENFSRVNVAQQREDKRSILRTYKELLQLRKENKALREGDLHLLDSAQDESSLLIYRRKHEAESVLVAINFSSKSAHIPQLADEHSILFKIGFDQDAKFRDGQMPPCSGIILQI